MSMPSSGFALRGLADSLRSLNRSAWRWFIGLSNHTIPLAGLSTPLCKQVFVELMMSTPSLGFALRGLADSLRSLKRTA